MDEKQMLDRIDRIEEGMKAVLEMLEDMPPTMAMALELHRKWIEKEEGGVRLDLSDTKLSGSDFRGADLTDADLRDVDMSRSNLSGGKMCAAKMTDTDMREANLSDADMRNAILRDARIKHSDLIDADLTGTDGVREGKRRGGDMPPDEAEDR